MTYLQNGLRCSLFSSTLVLADHFSLVPANCHSKLILLVTECVHLVLDVHLTKTKVPKSISVLHDDVKRIFTADATLCNRSARFYCYSTQLF